MAKKYILRSFKPGDKKHNSVNTLVTLNNLGMTSQYSVIKNSLAMGASQSALNTGMSSVMYPYTQDYDATDAFYQFRDVTKTSGENYAYYTMSYQQRVDYLRLFSNQPIINFALDTIADQAIVYDENNYFAQLDDRMLKANISATSEEAEKLLNDCDRAFKHVYSMYGWDRNQGGWHFFKKFLIDGFIAFEIIYDNLKNPTKIIGFKYLDPATLKPALRISEDGKEYKVWYQNEGSSEERIIPDINIIYISWSSDIMSGGENRISYLESLTKSYNMLSQMENSRLIWNIQNAQKRMKIIVPIADLAKSRGQSLVNELKADWTEDVHVDEYSGEVIVNGNPNFSFTKTYFFPQRTSGTITLEEIAPEGYDLSDITPLKYFWRRFIIESRIPANRFPLDLGDAGHSLNNDDSAITREEYMFSRFINRIRSQFREILLKPVWIQICLYNPKLAKSEYLKQALGIKFNEENMFVEAMERDSLKKGTDIVNTLFAIQGNDGKPYFDINFLVERYLGMSPEDLELNEKYKEQAVIDQLEAAKKAKEHAEYNAAHQTAAPQVPGAEGGPAGDFGGGMDFGGGGDFSGGGDDFGGGMDFSGSDIDMGGGAEAPAPEPAEAPAPEA